MTPRIPTVPALAGLAAVALATASASAQTVSFQNGVDGYNGTADRTISSSPDGNLSGGFNPEYFVDGLSDDGTSPDTQGLVRFDNIIGSGPGQIPAGATVLGATLQITTGVTSGNAGTNGPFGVSRLLQPFGDTSVYNQFGPNGPDFRNNSATRAIGGFDNPNGGFGILGTPLGANGIDAGEVALADVAPIVNAWANGAANNGVTIQAYSGAASTTNGWQIATSSNDSVAARPKLTVEYTTDPVTTVSFQQGTNGYAGTSGVVLNEDNTTLDINDDDFRFIDGSPNNPLLIKFDDVLASEGGSVPDGSRIVKAYLKLTTTDAEFSADSKTQGPYVTRQLLQGFELDSTAADFGGNGLSEDEGEVGPVDGLTYGRTAYSEAWMDVTDILQNFSDGQDNLGIAVAALGTGDGWGINLLGGDDASVRPELVVSYAAAVPEPTSLALLGLGGLAMLRRRRA